MQFLYNWSLFKVGNKGAGKKTGISEIRYIDMDISEIDTFDDVISDMSISDISRAKNGHIGLDISEI